MEPVNRFRGPLKNRIRIVKAQRLQRSRERREVPARIKAPRRAPLVRAVRDEELGSRPGGEEAVEPALDGPVVPVLEDVFCPVKVRDRQDRRVCREVVPGEDEAWREPGLVRDDDVEDDVDPAVGDPCPLDDLGHPATVSAAEIHDRADLVIADPVREPVDERLAESRVAPRPAPSVPCIRSVDLRE